MRLSRLVSLLIIGGALVSVVGVSIVSYLLISRSLQQSIGQQQVQLAQETMDKIDRLLHQRFNEIQAMAEDAEFENFLAVGGACAESCTKLQELSLLTGPWDLLTLVNTNDTIVGSTNQQEIGQALNQYQQSYSMYQKAREHGAVYSDLIVSERTGRSSVIFAAPVYDETQTEQSLVGVVIGHMAWPVVSEIVTTIPEAHLFNGEGQLIAAETTELNESRHEYAEGVLRQALQTEHADYTVTANARNDEQVLIAYAPQKGYLSYHGNHWLLLLERSTSVIFRPAQISAGILAGITGIIIFIIFALILLALNRVIIMPVLGLTRVAKAIEQGDTTQKAAVRGDDELSQLAQTFNTMTTALITARTAAETNQKELATKVGELERAKKATLNVLDDLNDEKRELSQANAKDEAIFSAIGDGLIVTDEKGIITKVNQTTLTLLNLPSSALLGQWYPKVISAVNEQGKEILPINRPNTQALLEGKPISGVLYFKRHEGQQFPVTITAAPILLNDRPVGVIEVFRDISKEKELEQMKNDFMNIAAHDLRTPTTAVKGFINMIRKGDFGPPPKGEMGDALADVEDATDRMITMVNDFLTVARIEQHRLKIEAQPIDPVDFLQDMVRQLAVTVDARPVKLQAQLPATLPKVLVDRQKMAQVITNLVDNALKHTEKGTVTVGAGVYQEKFVKITVADTGTGITPADLSKIFQRYFRGQQTEAVAAGRGGGLGLGLHVVKSIIELHGGKVWAESTVGQGTTIHFTVPIVVGSKSSVV